VEDGRLADFSQRLFLLEAFPWLNTDLWVFGVGCVDRDDFCCTYGGLAHVGVVNDELVALFHVAQSEERLVVGDAVPGSFAVSQQIVVGVLIGLGLEQVGHFDKVLGSGFQVQDASAAKVEEFDIGNGLAEELAAEAGEFLYRVGGVAGEGGCG